MAAPGRPEAVGASCALPAISRPPMGKTHPRRAQGERGPRRSRETDAERLRDLRRRCASSENRGTLQRISEHASELALTAPENLLGDIAAFIDRVHEKYDRLFPGTRERQAARVAIIDRATSPAISMRISAWVIDEHGNRSRVAWNSADGLRPPLLSLQP
jgi:hypothetical protein